VTALGDRRPASTGPDDVALPAEARPAPLRWAWAVAGVAVLVLMWLPPVIQQLTNHPGNFTLIVRYFTAGHPGQSLADALRSVAAAYGTVVVGPGEVVTAYLGGAPHHAVVSYLTAAVVVAAALGVTVIAIRQRRRFAAGLGALGLVASVAMVFAVVHLIGFIYGYLVVWAVVVPIAVLIGVGMLGVRWPTGGGGGGGGDPGGIVSATTVRYLVAALGVAMAVVLSVRVVAIPPLSAASNPRVAQLTNLVTPKLDPHGTVFVGDNGAGIGSPNGIYDTEEFIGLVNQLDQAGFRPTVNAFWKAEFGPGYLATGHHDRQINLQTWSPGATRLPGYVGRVGDIAVTVTGAGISTSS
jgi:hypothetical protein